MKIKTADLTGPALDWAVAQLEGKVHGYKHQLVDDCRQVVSYSPSTNWSQGGPLLEREKLELRCNDYEWQAFCFGFPVAKAHSGRRVWASGPAPLIAAMRCFCCAKLGDEIEIPQELQLCQQPNL